MTLNVYAIRDLCTGYMTPTFEINDNVAIRNFKHAILHSDSILNSHASDFSLYRIGYYDTDCAVLGTVEDRPVFLMNGKEALMDEV